MPPPALSGGARLQTHLDGIAQRLATAKEVHSGFLAGSTEKDGTPVPEVAAKNEWGDPAKRQPPRPFFRRMIAKHKGEWGGQLTKVLKAADYDAAKSLGLMGELIDGELRQSIVDLLLPPLAKFTIDKKGSTKPLIDSGIMLQSIDHEVLTT